MGCKTKQEISSFAFLSHSQVRPDWDLVNVELMYKALKSKFMSHPSLKSLLLSTSGATLVEASPSDLFWGAGREGEGLNYLGCLLMKLREELLVCDTPQ
jgi:diaminohydroxyphosphoribosylaminopyrimidine deaminase/5-amino-6-(5-phosphoribosylamino)uracil reductase